MDRLFKQIETEHKAVAFGRYAIEGDTLKKGGNGETKDIL